MKLREMVCPDINADCRACMLRFSCVYAVLFKPSLPQRIGRMQKIESVPPPLARRHRASRHRSGAGSNTVFGNGVFSVEETACIAANNTD
jgi:hypothetical protein